MPAPVSTKTRSAAEMLSFAIGVTRETLACRTLQVGPASMAGPVREELQASGDVCGFDAGKPANFGKDAGDNTRNACGNFGRQRHARGEIEALDSVNDQRRRQFAHGAREFDGFGHSERVRRTMRKPLGKFFDRGVEPWMVPGAAPDCTASTRMTAEAPFQASSNSAPSPVSSMMVKPGRLWPRRRRMTTPTHTVVAAEGVAHPDQQRAAEGGGHSRSTRSFRKCVAQEMQGS